MVLGAFIYTMKLSQRYIAKSDRYGIGVPWLGHTTSHIRGSRYRAFVALFLAFIVGLYFHPQPGLAAEPSFELHHKFGPGSDRTDSVVIGDMDNDGDLDIVVGNSSEQSAVYLNDGYGNFYSGAINCQTLSSRVRCFGTESDNTQSVAVGDMDGDGDLDIITGGIVHLNNGVGNFTSSLSFGADSNQVRSLAAGDIDGDRDLDIIVGNYGEQNAVYLNTGAGNFTSSHLFGTGSNNTESVMLGDIDGDSDLDVVASGIIYLNSGLGNFANNRPFSGAALYLGDIDGDSDLDIIAGGIINLNDGVGNFYNGVIDCQASSNSFRCFGQSNRVGSITVGDMDGDGDLDIVSGHEDWVNPDYDWVYWNDGSGNFTATSAFGSSEEWGSTVQVGDMDGDGDLDIVVGRWTQQNMLYRNNGAGNFYSMSSFAYEGIPNNVVIGDVSGDGALDIIVSQSGDIDDDLIYLNDGMGSFPIKRILGNPEDDARSVAIGDMDGDHDLDIVLGEWNQPNMLYLNDGVGNFVNRYLIGDRAWTNSLAIGDIDGDDDLDIVAGNAEHQDETCQCVRTEYSVVYLNDGVGNFVSSRTFGTQNDNLQRIAIGDMDNDGDLDIIAGGSDKNIVYLNDGTGNFADGYSFGAGNGDTISLAVGDVDSDGDLDILVGSNLVGTIIYLNKGVGNFLDVRFLGNEGTPQGIAVGDIDGDSDLDIAVVSYGQDRVYLNDGMGSFDNSRTLGISLDDTHSVALGDMDGDGKLDIVEGFVDTGFGRVFHNDLGAMNHLVSHLPWLKIARPVLTRNANFFSTPERLSDRVITIPYTLFDMTSKPIGGITAFFSLNGGGSWRPAVARTGTSTTNLDANPTGVNHFFDWDTYVSGFFGQSDNVIFRIKAYPSLKPQRNGAAGPYQYGYTSAQTFPFRVRGIQVQVYDETVQIGRELAGAFVYRLEKGHVTGAKPMPDTKPPLHTDRQGYLQGRGELSLDDQLIALWPLPSSSVITFTHNASLFKTSAKPTVQTLTMQPVTDLGVQALTVNANNKLLLFNLDVALEWDSRKDTQFMEQLQFNLQRTSQLLFDWTNGQTALGQVRIFHDAKRNAAIAGFQPWDDSHIRIYATNRMRPSATEGGIISPIITYTETVTIDGKLKTIAYGAGQVHMGAVWNRYGESSGALGEDWPRALAHELGHYLFFLEDDYLGVNEQGVLVTIPAEGQPEASCPGVMNDPYREAQSEFHPATGWAASGCAKTLSQQSMGRSDWATITKFYPLTAPTESFTGQNSGPSTLPLAVTQLQVISPTTIVQTVEVPIFYLTKADGGTYLPGANAQAYLFQGEWLTDLGQPTLDQVQAWGARPGDRLCIYESAAGYLGCEPIRAQDDQVMMKQSGNWQPEIVITPVTSRTIAVNVTVVLSDGKLAARLYPTDAPAPGCILLQAAEPGQYAGTFPTLAEPALDGYVHLWVQPGAAVSCAEPQGEAVLETVTGYAIGGNPIHRRARRTLTRGGGVHRRARRAPAISADGQVMVFGEALEANEDQEWFFTLQATSAIPAPPPGRTLVGQAYRLTASANAPSLSETSISFGYLGEQVPAGEENFLRIYFWAQAAATCQPQPAPCWQRLDTFVDPAYNVASAKTQGPGLYALLSSLEVPLTNAGWNNFAYPVPGTRSVAEALAAIESAYTVVYRYRPGEAEEAWQVYSPGAPDWVNDLKALEFGQGYWLYTTEAITLYLTGEEPTRAASAAGLTLPPATFYGTVFATSDFTPQPGMEVTAWIDGHPCGQSQVQAQGGQLVYVIKVVADDDSANDGCGAAGRTITFQVNGVSVATQGVWDNTQVWNLSPPQGDHQVFLPLVLH